MDLVRLSINKPVTITVGVILVIMFGLIGLGAIPIQLTPTVDRPIITVTTNWPGRSPQEVVDDVTREQEKRLKNVTNLKRMRSASREGQAEVTLEFYVGSDINRALQEVSDALRQVPDYPEEVDEPLIKAAEGSSENAIAWIIIDLDPAAAPRFPGFDITTLFDPLDKEVKPFLERIDGVAEVNVYGGRPREVRVLLDPLKLAERRLSHTEVIQALRAENRNVSAGTISEGKRDYRVRVEGQFVTEEDVTGTIVAYREGRPIYVRDLGTAEFGYAKQRGFVRSLGYPSVAINVIRQSGANVVAVMEELRARLDEVRADILPKLGGEVGPHLRLRQVYDETTYIDSAIDLVKENLWVGGLLATGVLLLFLRSLSATLVIALAIPISVIGTFLAMVAFGRTLNVISLAGLAFATGMVVDNAIVVLENIVRRRQMGDSAREAAYWGGKEVWVAVLASTLTTVAVFIPVLTIREESGQLFRDISLAIASAVMLSMLVSITVVPAAAARMLGAGGRAPRGRLARSAGELFGLAPAMGALTARFAHGMEWLMTGWRAWSLRPVIIGVLAAASVVGAAKMAPPLDYLPTGNRNLVFGGLIIPPGYNVAQMTSIAERLEEKLGAYVKAGSDPALLATLPPIPQMPMPGAPLFDPVGIDNFFIGSFGGGMFVGATSAEEQRVIPIGSLLTNAMNSIPGAYGGASQASIFGRGAGGGNTVNVEISGPRLERVTAAAQMIFGIAGGKYGFGRSVTADPNNFNLSQPETRLRLNARGRELGLTTRDAGEAVRALFDGAFVDDFRLGGETVDMVVLPLGGRKPGRLDYREQLASIPVATPSGRVVPLDTVVDVVQSEAPPQISRSEELPSVSVRVRPPQGMTVEDVMVELERDVVGAARQAGLIDQSMRVRLEGTAASLDEVRASLFGATDPRATVTGWRRGVIYVSWGLAALGVLAGVWVLVRSARMGRGAGVYGAIGVALLAVVIAGLLGGLAWQPQLATARFIWALAVTYLLMCAIFESFLYPLVIMVSVPLAMVGGFGGLAIVHEVTRRDLTQPTQNLDVLTMLGFVILIGTVVNNAILIVEQSLNFMDPARYGSADPPMPRLTAIREALRSRVRPVMMTTATTVGGMLPLVVAPGAGSEMYRGLGAVVLGGLIVSTIFTLVLVPLAFSLVLDMSESARAALSLGSGVAPGGRGGLPGGPAERNGAAPARRAVPVSESPPA